MNDNRCIICGARLSDNNTEGIGFECKAALMYAKGIMLKETDFKLQCFIYEAEAVKKAFLDVYAGVKFRSEFRKGFYTSMQQAQRISRKQVDIMWQMIDDRNTGLAYTLHQQVAEYNKQLKIQMMAQMQPTLELINIARKYIKR